MIAQIIAELESIDKEIDKLRNQANDLRIRYASSDYQTKSHLDRAKFLEGEAEGLAWAHRRFKRLIDQTPEGIAWERGQGKAGKLE